ncbi:MAG: aldehyde ferredoxin oxidoreductase family protein [Deltaproteobacteria bacterium]|nr:aldehyde ferredoxin oxidoreductase family protein [Deltaproteobacteria bacterium]
MAHLYGGSILFVNLSAGKISRVPTASYARDFLGGRGINIKLLYDGLPPSVDPLDPANLLIFGVGPLCGSPVPAGRVEVTFKSPETGYLGSSNFGGFFGAELKFAGYDNVVISGKADKPVYVWIYNDQVEIRDAAHLWGRDTYETQVIIRRQVDPEAKTVCIGPAGENRVRFATVQHDLGHGGGRTGSGAVMGSKNLKAIVVRGTRGITFADPVKYLSIAEELQQALENDIQTKQIKQHGMSRTQDILAVEKLEMPAGEGVAGYDCLLKYDTKKAGCFGCRAQCMELYPTKVKGGGAVSCGFYVHPFELVGNSDIDMALECGFLAQRYGVDIISAMSIVSWLMKLYHKGIITAEDTDGIAMEWGSRQAIVSMLEKIVHREGFGDVLADGILPAVEKIGRGAGKYAYQVKGLPMHEDISPVFTIPSKGNALAFVVSSRGDSMKARPARMIDELDAPRWLGNDGKKAEKAIEAMKQKALRLSGTDKAIIPGCYEGKPELTIYSEDTIVLSDCMGSCKYMGPFLGAPFDETYQAALFSAGTGIEKNVEDLLRHAKRVRNLERAFCAREGMTRETDKLPGRFMDQAIKKGPHKGEILKTDDFEAMKSKYYELRGWDAATGIPSRETLEQIGLGYVTDDLEKMGKLK